MHPLSSETWWQPRSRRVCFDPKRLTTQSLQTAKVVVPKRNSDELDFFIYMETQDTRKEEFLLTGKVEEEINDKKKKN